MHYWATHSYKTKQQQQQQQQKKQTSNNVNYCDHKHATSETPYGTVTRE